MNADLTKTVAPKTDQLNADDFIGSGDRTITITGVKMIDSKDQPIAISYEGDKGKPWKPCLGMRRILIEVWGQEAAKEASKHYVGRSVTLFRDPDVKFGGVTVGGIRISHASNLTAEKKIALTVAKARRVEFVVKPLKNAPPVQQKKEPEQKQTDPATELFSSEPMTAEEFAALKKKVFDCPSKDELKLLVTEISNNSARMTQTQKDEIQHEYKETKASLDKADL